MSEELNTLKLVTRRLEERGIRYMITGSIAANFYTIPRMTRDIDIVVELDAQKADKVYAAFKDEFYVDREMIANAMRRESMFNIIHDQSLIKVDFIVRKKSEYRKLEFSRRRSVVVEGARLFIVSPEDLVISKLFWAKESHSEIQLNDVRNILEDVPEIDKEYLEKWVTELELEDVYRGIREEVS